MKILIVGGAHQGKRAYAEESFGLLESDFRPGGRALDSLHLAVRDTLGRGGDPEEILRELETRESWVVLCDEVGSGVIPLERADRDWRETVGRLCCRLAERADIVERVSCGIPLRLKGQGISGERVRIVLIRHGKTPGNLRGAFVGSIDQPVAPEGLEDLRARTARRHYPQVQLVMSSPMRRCVETACVIYPDDADKLTAERDTYTIPDLRERCFGDFEGKTHAEIIEVPGHRDWGRTESSMVFPGGEEYEPFLARVGSAFWAAADWMAREGVRDMAIVTHGGVIMGILAQYADPEKGYFDWACENGGGYILECDTLTRRIEVREKL